MDTYTIQKIIMDMDALNTNEKCLGMCLAHAVDRSTGKVRRTRSWMAQSTGLAGGSLHRSIAGLVKAGVLTPIRTGRSTIYDFRPLLEVKCGRVDGPPEDHQTVPQRTIGMSDRHLKPVGSSRENRELELFKAERELEGKPRKRRRKAVA